ncbi:hypothetical protein AALP_AA4G050900 [Arabis alpina]|uniref:Uncharacterized protein n=1 Tax=Arabis alpina TaxID=50452 RepID=A0A087H197_ARAAL|nr:hypothetical protein AALP_AA4G050900 [Arabis alpina]
MMKKNLAIRPAEFYGNGLPRPRFFDNPQFNSHRVDPPLSVLDPLLSWARDAHWSMGGLNFTRLRLQGRIEGNVNKLRAQLEHSTPVKLESEKKKKKTTKRSGSESPPSTPIVVKRRRRYLDLIDDDEEIGSEDEGVARIRRKLSVDFDRVAQENKTKPTTKSVELESSGKAEKVKETRTSPRLAKPTST